MLHTFVRTKENLHAITPVIAYKFYLILIKVRNTEDTGSIPFLQTAGIILWYHRALFMVTQQSFHIKRACPAQNGEDWWTPMRLPTGKETAEEQLDQLILSVTYFCW